MAAKVFYMYKGFEDSDQFSEFPGEHVKGTTFEMRTAYSSLSRSQWFANTKVTANSYAVLCVDATHEMKVIGFDSSFTTWIVDAERLFKDRVFILLKGNPKVVSLAWKNTMPASFKPFELNGKMFVWEDLPPRHRLATLCEKCCARINSGVGSLSWFHITLMLAILIFAMAMFSPPNDEREQMLAEKAQLLVEQATASKCLQNYTQSLQKNIAFNKERIKHYNVTINDPQFSDDTDYLAYHVRLLNNSMNFSASNQSCLEFTTEAALMNQTTWRQACTMPTLHAWCALCVVN